MVIKSVVSIDTPEGKVTDKGLITEFFNNADRESFNAILNHLEKMKENSTLKPMKVRATPEEVAAGAPEEYEIPITFDQSNFFA